MRDRRRLSSLSTTTISSTTAKPSQAMSTAATAAGYVCDTIPPARLATAAAPSRSPSPVPPTPVTAFKTPQPASIMSHDVSDHKSTELTPLPGRKLCVRHQRMADEGTNLKLQQVSTVFASPSLRSLLRVHRGLGGLRKYGATLSPVTPPVNQSWQTGVLCRPLLGACYTYA